MGNRPNATVRSKSHNRNYRAAARKECAEVGIGVYPCEDPIPVVGADSNLLPPHALGLFVRRDHEAAHGPRIRQDYYIEIWELDTHFGISPLTEPLFLLHRVDVC
jgi:hypothetical protein